MPSDLSWLDKYEDDPDEEVSETAKKMRRILEEQDRRHEEGQRQAEINQLESQYNRPSGDEPRWFR